VIVPADAVNAMLNEGKAANGSFGEGDATTDLCNRALGAFGAGLSKDCPASARVFLLGRPGDQSEPSLCPNMIGTFGDVTASRATDGDSMFSGSRETDCQKAWLRRALSSEGDASPVRLRGGGLVTVNRGDSWTEGRNCCANEGSK
jgi:hypothetical protein